MPTMLPIFIILTHHFSTVAVGAFAPGTRVTVENFDGSPIPATVLGLAATCADDEQPWIAVRLDGHTFDYGDGPGVEHRPADQLSVVS